MHVKVDAKGKGKSLDYKVTRRLIHFIGDVPVVVDYGHAIKNVEGLALEYADGVSSPLSPFRRP